jgi:uncharacterized membrane protein
MNHSQGLSNRIDAYLLQLRECLGELPSEEVTDILREIRGHILERAEANGELTEERLVAILKSLGRPEEIAPLYQADAAVARAKVSLSPRVVMRGIQRWSRVSGWGLALFITGVATPPGSRCSSAGSARSSPPRSSAAGWGMPTSTSA